jgi:hypothetical protein
MVSRIRDLRFTVNINSLVYTVSLQYVRVGEHMKFFHFLKLRDLTLSVTMVPTAK